MRLSNCALSCIKKSRFIKEQEASGIIGSLAKSFSQISSIGSILFEMNKIINRFLLSGDKFMSETHLS